MGLLWKRMNLNPEATAWGRQMQERLEEALGELKTVREFLGTTSKIGSTSANQALGAAEAGRSTQEQLDALSARVDELSKALLPAGSFPGSVLRANRDGALKWYPNLNGATPFIYMGLEDSAPWYEWSDHTGINMHANMPEVDFIENGKGFRVIAFDHPTQFGADIPISYDIGITPHFDGEQFFVSIRSDGYGVRGLGRFDITIRNESPTFSPRVHIGSNDLANDFEFRYHDSAVIPWLEYPDPVGNPGYLNHEVVLAPKESVAWISEGTTTTWANSLTPGLATAEDVQGVEIGYPQDSYYWKKVQSLKETKEFTATGELSTLIGKGLKNASSDTRRIGLIHASVGFAPSGADILIDVKMNGASIFTAPLAIADGTTETSKEPDVYTHGPGGSIALKYTSDIIPSSVLWRPGDELSVDVVGVGTTAKGADLTVQVYYG